MARPNYLPGAPVPGKGMGHSFTFTGVTTLPCPRRLLLFLHLTPAEFDGCGARTKQFTARIIVSGTSAPSSSPPESWRVHLRGWQPHLIVSPVAKRLE